MRQPLHIQTGFRAENSCNRFRYSIKRWRSWKNLLPCLRSTVVSRVSRLAPDLRFVNWLFLIFRVQRILEGTVHSRPRKRTYFPNCYKGIDPSRVADFLTELDPLIKMEEPKWHGERSLIYKLIESEDSWWFTKRKLLVFVIFVRANHWWEGFLCSRWR